MKAPIEHTGPEVVPRCRCNDRPMELARSYPRIGAMPELRSFQCKWCGHVEIIELDMQSPGDLGRC